MTTPAGMYRWVHASQARPYQEIGGSFFYQRIADQDNPAGPLYIMGKDGTLTLASSRVSHLGKAWTRQEYPDRLQVPEGM